MADSIGGGLAAGFGQGFGAMMQLGQIKAQREAAAAQNAFDQKQFEVKYWDSVGSKWEEATRIDDPNLKNLAFKALVGDAEAKLGKKAPPLLVDFFKQDPEQVSKALAEFGEEGITFGQIALIGANPGLAAQGITALAKRLRQKQGAEAAAGAESAVHPSTGVQAAPGLAGAAELMRGRLAEMRQRLKLATDRGVEPRLLAGLQSSIDATEQDLTKITTSFQLSEAERGAALATPEMLSQIGGVPGTRVRDLPGQQRATTGAPAAPAASGTAPASAAPGGAPSLGLGRFETPQEKTTRERRAKSIDTLGERIAREAGQSGIKTVGEYEDALKSGKFKPRTPEEAVRQEKIAEVGETEAQKLYETYIKAGDTANEMMGAYTLMASSLKSAGPTGAIAGPVRRALFQVGAAVGLKAEALEKIETVDSLSIFLASQTLKDFTGNDSDREFMAAIQRNPNIAKQTGTNEALIRIGLHNEQMKRQRVQFASKWKSDYGSLTSRHPTTKRTFDAAWQAYRNAVPPILSLPARDALLGKGSK